MKTGTRRLGAFGAAAAFALGALATRETLAQEQKPGADDAPITVYRPYKNMDEIFEKGGVFLPSDELDRLLKMVKELQTRPQVQPDAPPPAPFVHVGSHYRGSADESVARFEATFDFEVLEKKKWVEIPLGLGRGNAGDVSLEEAKTSDGKRAVVRQTADGGFAILVQGAGPLSVTTKFTVAVKKDRPGQRSFDLRLPKAALSTFEVDLPERGLRVDCQPSLGTSLKDASLASGAGATHVTAYLGATDAPLNVTWYPRPKEVEGPQKSLIFSDLSVGLRLDEGVARAFAAARYNVEQAPTDTFKIAVAKGWKILDVSADGMRENEVTEGATGVQILRVSFHERVKQALVTFRLERTRDDSVRFAFPAIRTLDAERETGIVAAGSSTFLKLEAATVKGLSQVDPSEIPARLAAEIRNEANGERPPLGFRYLKNEFSLDLATAKVEPEVEGKVFAIATVKDDEVTYNATIAYEIKKRGIFSVRVKLPAGFTLLDCGDETTVKSTNVREATAADKWTGTILDVDFPRQARPGPYWLKLSGTLSRKDAAKLALPVVALDGVTKETGVLALAAQKHLKLTSAGAATNLVPVAVAELPALGFPYGVQENEELVFGFKYGKPGAAATVDVAKREPKVTTSVEMVANADLDRINVDGDVRYKVEFAGVDKLRLRVPAELNNDQAFKLTADGASIKEKKLVETDQDKATKTVVWEVELQSKREGSFKLHFHYEVKLPAMNAGEQRDVGLHEVIPLDVSRETGDLVLLKHENLVISDANVEGLETRHPTRELPESLAKLGGFRGYHSVGRWKLDLRIIKYDFQAPLQKIIEQLHVDEVVLRDGTLQAEAWIRLRNNQGQFLRVLMPRGSEARAVRVGEKNVAPSKFVSESGQPGVDVMLPEESRRGDSAVLVRIRYWIKDPKPFSSLGSLELDAPTFPTDDKGDAAKASVPVARFTRSLYLPDSVCYTDFDTDMTTHFERGGLFEGVKKLVYGHLREEEGAAAALAASQQIHAQGTQDTTGAYPPLEHPTRGQSGGGPRLFEKLDGQAKLKVSYASWSALYGLGVISLVLVVALGAFVESRKIVSAISYFAVTAGATFAAAICASRSVEPFLTTAFAGSVGVGSYWMLRSVWRELTVERHRRRLETLQREAEVAKARAAAAEAEARAAQGRPAPAAPAEKAPANPADEAAGRNLGFDESLKRDLPPEGGAPAAPGPQA